jgi:hypothetical protein
VHDQIVMSRGVFVLWSDHFRQCVADAKRRSADADIVER